MILGVPHACPIAGDERGTTGIYGILAAFPQVDKRAGQLESAVYGIFRTGAPGPLCQHLTGPKTPPTNAALGGEVRSRFETA